ncbi:MAG: 4-oxalocrotonate tautomerase [Sphingopyxis sp.]
MPIVNFHLIDGRHDDAAIGRLLVAASHFYVETLYPGQNPPPLDRVRAFVTPVVPGHWATAGVLASDGGADAPYFTCLTLAGRPVEQLHRLISGFTDLLVAHLACARASVRGQVLPIDPAHWGIGGAPASAVRQDEAALRAG